MLGTGRRLRRGPTAHATLHPVGSQRTPHHNPAYAGSAAAREAGPLLYDGASVAPWLSTVARCPRQRGDCASPLLVRSGPQDCSLGYQTDFEITPERDEQLPRQGSMRCRSDLSRSSTFVWPRLSRVSARHMHPRPDRGCDRHRRHRRLRTSSPAHDRQAVTSCLPSRTAGGPSFSRLVCLGITSTRLRLHRMRSTDGHA